jgi:hypothetical protein
LCSAFAHGAVVRRASPTVQLDYATYQGVRLDAGVDQYLGMRFAAPPLGDLRFRAPQDPESASTIQDASAVSTSLAVAYFPSIYSRHMYSLLV